MIPTARPTTHRPSVEQFTNDQPWMKDGACKGADPELFFPEGEQAVRTRAWLPVCASCPVRALCLAGAIERKEKLGVWGGKYFTVKGVPGREPGASYVTSASGRTRKSRAKLTPEQLRAAYARPRDSRGRLVKAGG